MRGLRDRADLEEWNGPADAARERSGRATAAIRADSLAVGVVCSAAAAAGIGAVRFRYSVVRLDCGGRAAGPGCVGADGDVDAPVARAV